MTPLKAIWHKEIEIDIEYGHKHHCLAINHGCEFVRTFIRGYAYHHFREYEKQAHPKKMTYGSKRLFQGEAFGPVMFMKYIHMLAGNNQIMSNCKIINDICNSQI